MARIISLSAAATVTLDGSGRGTAAVGPYFPAVPGLATPGAATPGDPGGPVIFDGDVGATASAGPAFAGEVWYPESVSIACTGTIPSAGTPTVFLYAGASPAPSTFIDSTYDVTSASSSMIAGRVLYPGQQVFAVWTNGPAGGEATIVVSGTRKVP